MDVNDCFIVAFLMLLIQNCHGNHDAKRLYDDLLLKRNFNKLIRPVGDYETNITVVKLGIKLAQIINVDEKNEIVTTNVYISQEWEDYNLRWNPREYGGVEKIYVPSEKIWIPDIVLYNNADGDYVVTMMTKATLTYTGQIIWQPPAIFKSQCDINVEFFPFDQQECDMKFSVWSYSGLYVDVKHIWQDTKGREVKKGKICMDNGIDLKSYYRSVEWDLLRVPACRNEVTYPCCPGEIFPDITFQLFIRRKVLFYAINLMIPCVSINLLTVLTFYLPSDSGEKISLSITILLSLSMFQLLMMELVPSSSISVPLIGKFITFTTATVSVSIFVSVLTLNVNFRSGSTHDMSPFTKKVFLDILPKLLLMRKPHIEKTLHWDTEEVHSDFADVGNPYKTRLKPAESVVDNSIFANQNLQSTFIGVDCVSSNDVRNFCNACMGRRIVSQYSGQLAKALDGSLFVAKHLKEEDEGNRVKDDWKYVALVIDRILLWIYLAVCVIGSMCIMLTAPSLYDTSEALMAGQ